MLTYTSTRHIKQKIASLYIRNLSHLTINYHFTELLQQVVVSEDDIKVEHIEYNANIPYRPVLNKGHQVDMVLPLLVLLYPGPGLMKGLRL